MVRAIYTATSGMMAESKKNDTVSSNLFYAQIPGFKAVSVQRAARPATGFGVQTDLQTAVIGQYSDLTAGPLRPSGRPLDMAIDGDGLFVIQTKGGLAYTRDGRFARRGDNGVRDGGGNTLMGEKGPIQFPEGTRSDPDVKIEPDGTLRVDGKVIDRILVQEFPGFRGLQSAGGSVFFATGATEPVPSKAIVTQGVVEDSNVSSVSEMVRMVETTRAFESYQKMIQTIDETTAESVRRLGRLG